MSLRVAVQRFNPAVDRAPYLAVYDVSADPRRTVLDALLEIADQHDPTLAFRRTCCSGICGACAGTVNGQATLFCQARLLVGRPPDAPVAARREPDLVVGPLPGFAVLRDLVVDMDGFFEEFVRHEAWLVPAGDYAGRVPEATARRLWAAAGCVLCGICQPLRPREDGPHAAAIVQLLRLAHDPRDRAGTRRLERLGPDASVAAELAPRLQAVCPKRVDLSPLAPAPDPPGARADGARP